MLGLDPGYGRLGWAVVEQRGHSLAALGYGVFETPAGSPFGERLLAVHGFVQGLAQRHAGAEAAVEALFFSRNTSTAMAVAQARGAILLALCQAGIDPLDISPQHVKMAVAASGKAGKAQVQAMTQRLLGLKSLPQPDDAADALALALAGLRSLPLRRLQARLAPLAKTRTPTLAKARPRP
jgi:crossover junction endodeoxyribonuclease RuvC